MTDAPSLPDDARSLCAFLVERLVDEPGTVTVTEEPHADGVLLRIDVAPEERGKVIGKGGRVIRALRSVVRAAGIRHGQRVLVEVGE